MYVTPAGARKNALIVESINKIYFDENNNMDIPSLRKEGKVSGEIMMHYLLQQNQTETTCVLHLHPTYTVAAMYAGINLSEISKDFPEIFRYTRVGKNVTNHAALSDDLATETFDNLQGFDIVGQKNHGVTAVGKNPWAAFEHIERLEHICKIFLSSR
jgi:L-fuculose-phosphate aldolase